MVQEISIIKVPDVDTQSSIRESVRKAIDLVGGMHSVVKGENKVVIKPNFFGPRSASNGATTNLTVVREIVEEVIECGGYPIIAEGPFRFYDANVVFQKLGVKNLAKNLGIELVNLNAAEAVEKNVPGGKALKRIKISKLVLDADVLINVPKIKTHHLTTVTLGMKNMKGVLPGREKQKSHIYGIHQSIVDINKVIRSDLIVVDGTVAMEGMGPTFGHPVKFGIVVAGKNVVDVDVVCCKLMGLDPMQVKHLRLACKNGLCSQNVKTVGDSIETVRRRFLFPRESKPYLYAHSIAEKIDPIVYKISGKNIFPYLSGLFGKRPRIDLKKCTKCGICEKMCILSPPAINSQTGKIDYHRCVDCLLCMEHCPRNAISVKGIIISARSCRGGQDH